MPTKIRYILHTKDGNIYSGKHAIRVLCGMMANMALSSHFPDGWARLSRRQKLSYLAKSMPPKTKLFIYHEPRNCRKNKSLYIKALQGNAFQEPPEKPAPQIHWNWNGNFEVPQGQIYQQPPAHRANMREQEWVYDEGE